MLHTQDPILADMIAKESKRQDYEIELIASENYVSQEVLEANGSILTNKYAEWYPWKRYYWGCYVVDEIEQLAIDRAKELFWAEHANVQPLSGSPANMAVYMALLQPWDTILWFSLDQGWHLSHGHPMNFSGILYNVIPYHINQKTEEIDMDELEKLARTHKPKLIIAWFSAYSRDLNWKQFRKIADMVWAYLVADMAHIAGLIAAWIIESPVPYCDVVTSTTHKTLRWPRWGLILCKAQYAKTIDKMVFPWIQGWPHENLIAGKAVAFWEALKPEFKEYQKQVVKNAQTLARELQSLWCRIIWWGTSNHLMLLDVYGSFDITGKDAEKILEQVWLSCNKNMIPYDTRSPMNPSWIRIGTPAATTRGMKESEMKLIADIIIQALTSQGDITIIDTLRKKIIDLCEQFPIYSS